MSTRRPEAVMQSGLRPGALGADVLPCIKGPADGQKLAVCESDVICVVNPFPGERGPVELNAISCSNETVSLAVQMGTYVGHYVRVGNKLRWRTDATEAHGAAQL